jgi:L-iditol 2-dehydrogenase
MLAGQITAPRRLEWIEIPIPEPGPGQIVVRLEAGAICGSDIPYFKFDQHHPVMAAATLPLAPTLSLHELVGRVIRSRSERFPEGARVLALPYVHRGLAECFLSDEKIAVPMPDGPADRLVLSQPLGTVVHACRKLPNVVGWTAVVVGQGPIGQLFNALLRTMGVTRIIAVDLLADRLGVSPKMGATHTLLADEGSDVPVREAVKELTGGLGADLVVEAVGLPAALNTAFRMIRRNGTVLAFGVPHVDQYEVAYRELFWNEGRLICSIGPDVQVEFPIAIDLIAGGTIDVSPIVTHHFPLAQAQDAFTLFADRSDGAIKVILEG